MSEQRKEQREALSRQIGQKVKEIRKSRKMTQTTLAGRIGVSRACLAMYEAGTTTIPIPTLYRIAYHLGVEISSIIPENHPVPPKPHEPMPELSEAKARLLMRMRGAI